MLAQVFLAILDPSAGLTLKMLSLKLPAVLALTCSARAHELIKLDLDFVSIKSDFWELSLAEHTRCQELVAQLEKFLCLLFCSLHFTGASIQDGDQTTILSPHDLIFQTV